MRGSWCVQLRNAWSCVYTFTGGPIHSHAIQWIAPSFFNSFFSPNFNILLTKYINFSSSNLQPHFALQLFSTISPPNYNTRLFDFCFFVWASGVLNLTLFHLKDLSRLKLIQIHPGSVSTIGGESYKCDLFHSQALN